MHTKTKPVTPYQRLLTDVKKWCLAVKYRPTVAMFLYPKDRLHEGWNLSALYERTAAAGQLGYDVQLTADAAGLHVIYKKKVPEVPSQWD